MKTDLLRDGAVSRLYIARASKADSGNYTCGMRNAQTSVTVHILNGERVSMHSSQRFGFLSVVQKEVIEEQ